MVSSRTADPFQFEMDPPGHWHVFWLKTLRFMVTNFADGQAATPSTVRAIVTRANDGSVSELLTERQNDGSYTTEFTPSVLTPHAVVLVVEDGPDRQTSRPWAIEIARDGEEGIRAEAGGSTYVYQVRFDWSPGPILADDDDPAVLTFELMRGVQEGDAIKWDQPWFNTFENVGNAEDPSVHIQSDDGAQETIEATYQSMGVYVARRVFSRNDVGAGKTYGVRFTFRDPYNGAQVTNAEAYPLTVLGSLGT